MIKYPKQVTGAIIRRGGKILIAQRGENDEELPLMWEFPGGKLEEGETPEECVVREIKEELELDIAVEGVYAAVLYHLNGHEIPITFFNAKIVGGKMRLNVHQDVRWILAGEIPNYSFMPPDIEVAGRLLEEYKKKNIPPDLAAEYLKNK